MCRSCPKHIWPSAYVTICKQMWLSTWKTWKSCTEIVLLMMWGIQDRKLLQAWSILSIIFCPLHLWGRAPCACHELSSKLHSCQLISMTRQKRLLVVNGKKAEIVRCQTGPLGHFASVCCEQSGCQKSISVLKRMWKLTLQTYCSLIDIEDHDFARCKYRSKHLEELRCDDRCDDVQSFSSIQS